MTSTSPVAADADPIERSRPRRTRSGTLARVLGAVAIVAGLTAWFTVASTHAYAANADGATVVLEGLTFAHGNVLLHNWALSLDSFWGVDVVFYGIVQAIAGVGPTLMHLVPALVLALCIVVGAALVVRDTPGRVRSLALGVLVVGLCLPGHAMAYFLLQGPWHVATTLYCLVAIACLRHDRFDWRWAVAVVLLALGLNGDLQMLALGVVPIALAGVVAMVRQRRWAAGRVTLAAAGTATVLALVLRAIFDAIGTFGVSESHHTVKAAQLGRDVGHFGNWFGAIMGTHPGAYGGVPVPLGLEMLRYVVVAVVVVGCIGAVVAMVMGLWRGASTMAPPVSPSLPPWRVDDLLLCCLAGSIGVFGLLTLSDNILYARYLDPVVIFGVVLAARVLPRWLEHRPALWRRAGAALAVVTFATSAVTAVSAAAEASPSAPTAPLESFLETHHLTVGVGDYWAASIVTVDTGQRIVVRPVVANLEGRIVPDGRQATSSWYRGVGFQFLVYERKPYGRVNPASVLRSFGTPTHVYVIGEYHVLTWSHPLTVDGPAYP